MRNCLVFNLIMFLFYDAFLSFFSFLSRCVRECLLWYARVLDSASGGNEREREKEGHRIGRSLAPKRGSFFFLNTELLSRTSPSPSPFPLLSCLSGSLSTLPLFLLPSLLDLIWVEDSMSVRGKAKKSGENSSTKTFGQTFFLPGH